MWVESAAVSQCNRELNGKRGLCSRSLRICQGRAIGFLICPERDEWRGPGAAGLCWSCSLFLTDCCTLIMGSVNSSKRRCVSLSLSPCYCLLSFLHSLVLCLNNSVSVQVPTRLQFCSHWRPPADTLATTAVALRVDVAERKQC